MRCGPIDPVQRSIERGAHDQTKWLTIGTARDALTSERRQELPGLFVADLLQQLLPVLDVLFVLLRG
jgi:hypothetical protein